MSHPCGRRSAGRGLSAIAGAVVSTVVCSTRAMTGRERLGQSFCNGGHPPVIATAAFLLAVVFFEPLYAQSGKPPGLGYVFPPVIRAGEVTSVQLGGFDFTSDMQWFVHNERVHLKTDGVPGDYHIPPPPYWTGPRAGTAALPIPREVSGQIEVDSNASPGHVFWQVANANGVSETAVFLVSRDAEIVESRSRDFPQTVPSLPIGVSGRLSRLAEVDHYQFVAERDGTATVTLMARTLGADFNGVIQVLDESGRLLADFADTIGLDGSVTVPVIAGRTYMIRLHDMDFRGDRSYVYHLHITQDPRVLCSVPAAVSRVNGTEVELTGLGFRSGAAILEKIRQPLPNLNSSDTSTVLSYSTQIGDGKFEIPVSELRELVYLDREEQKVMPIEVPCAVTGLMLPGISEHRLEWLSSKEERWSLKLQARELGSRMDVSLDVIGPAGDTVASSDDIVGSTDAELEFLAVAEGRYTAVVRSLSSSVNPAGETGTAVDLYRLKVERALADFSLSVPQTFAIALGGKAELPIKVVRHGGFSGDIRLTVSGLPEGVTAAAEAVIPGTVSEFKLPLESKADAAVVASVIHVAGTAKTGDSEITRPAFASFSGNLCPLDPNKQRTSDVLLALTMAAPFDVMVVDRERQHDVHRGTTFLAELDIVRKDGFNGDIQLEMTAKQDRVRMGLRGGILNVPAGQTKAYYPTFLPEWLSTDLTRRIIVHGVAAVPDPKGTIRYVSRAGDARITMIMEGALLKLTAEASEITVVPGTTFEIPVTIARSAKLPLPTTVELVIPEEILGLLNSESVTVAADQTKAILTVTTSADARLEGPWQLTVKATALQDEKWPVISEAVIPVEFRAP